MRWWRRRRARYVSTAAPIVLAGCQRSGTTLLRVILDSHSHIACGPESSLLTGSFLPDKLAARFETPIAEIWQLHRQTPDHAEFIDRFLTRYAQHRGKRRWAEKTPQNIRHLDWIKHHFPHAKIVHILRDGRDVACSIRTHPRVRYVNGQPVETGIRRPLAPCIRSWLDDTTAGLRWRGAADYYEVKYEDLVAETEWTLRKLCEFLGEPWEETLLEYHLQKGASRDPRHFIVNVAATQPLGDQAIQRWRRDLTPADLELFYRLAGDRLATLGYSREPAMDPRLKEVTS